MNNLTVLLPTVNKVPKTWMEYFMKTLLESIGDSKLIILDQNVPYWIKILEGLKKATTPYIAIVEDDTLYSKEHFEYRPKTNTFAYNLHRWIIFTWEKGRPFYFLKSRAANSNLIAPRELAIEYLLKRPFKYRSELGPQSELGTYPGEPKPEIFYTWNSVLGFNHIFSHEPLQQSKKKRAGSIRAYDIPIWGKAEDMIKKFQ